MLKYIVFLVVSCLIINESTAQTITQASLGAFRINGDVEADMDAMNSFHFAINRKWKKDFWMEGKIGLGKGSGTSLSYTSNVGALKESVYQELNNTNWYPNYITTYGYVDLGLNYRPEIGTERIRFWVGAGLGISLSGTAINLVRGEQRDLYDLTFVIDNPDELRSRIKNSYDDIYETSFDEGNLVNPHLYGQIGFQVKIKKNLFFSVDLRHHLTFTDYLDPIQYNGLGDDTNNNDSASMLTIGIMSYLFFVEDEQRPDQN